jgi:hypothetical protein
MSNEKGIVLLAILLALDKLSKASNEKKLREKKSGNKFPRLKLMVFYLNFGI